MTLTDEDIPQALADIVEYMHDHDASSFVDALREAASAAEFDALEARLGAPLGSLRLLYGWHDGQELEREPLFEHLFFLPLETAERMLPSMLYAYLEPPAGTRAASYHRSTQGFTLAELESPRWLPFANCEGDFLAVQLDTGKVARIMKGELPWLSVEAPNLATFLGRYASWLWDGGAVLMGDPSEPGVELEGMRWLGRYFGRG